jgi:hypothetical protein
MKHPVCERMSPAARSRTSAVMSDQEPEDDLRQYAAQVAHKRTDRQVQREAAFQLADAATCNQLPRGKVVVATTDGRVICFR